MYVPNFNFLVILDKKYTIIILPQKLKRRLSALAKTKAFTDEKNKKFEPAFTVDLISSEESSLEEADGLQSVTFLVRQLPWRSDVVTDLFLNLKELQ